jgi:hypothetical protein
MSNYVQSTNFATKDALPSGDPLKIVKGTEINTEFNNIATAVATKADLASPVLTSPTLVTPALGTPTSGNLANAVGLPIVAGTTGTLSVARGGTGVTTSTGTGNNVLSASPTFTGTPAAPTASVSTNTTQIATTAFVQAALQKLHPVGSIYINATNSTNPGTLLGFGTWTAFGAGRVPVGFNASDPLFDTAEETGGSKNAIVVSHTHSFSATTSTGSLTGSVNFGANGIPSNSGSGIVSTADPGAANQAGFGSGTVNRRLDIDASHNHTVSGTTGTTGSSATNANLQPYITVYMWKRTA